MAVCILPALGAVAFVDEDEQVALGLEVLGQAGACSLAMKSASALVWFGLVSAELVDQGAEQPWGGWC
jgi:hypothetical protein